MGLTRLDIRTRILRTVKDTGLTSESNDWIDDILDVINGLGYWGFLQAKATYQTENTVRSISFKRPKFPSDDDTGVNSDPGLAVGSTPEKVANETFQYQIAGTIYPKAADAVGAIFSAVHLIAANTFGAINIYIDTSGTISSRVPGDQTGTQAFATSALANAAADDVEPLTNLTYIGRIVIQNDASLWTANTDDLTDASDVTAAVFTDAISEFFTQALTDYLGGISISSSLPPFKLDYIPQTKFDDLEPENGAPKLFSLQGAKPGNEILSVHPTPVTGATTLPLLTINYFKPIQHPASDTDDFQDTLNIPRIFNPVIIDGGRSLGLFDTRDDRSEIIWQKFLRGLAALAVTNNDWFDFQASQVDRQSLLDRILGLSMQTVLGG